jgi:hypothetical protein
MKPFCLSCLVFLAACSSTQTRIEINAPARVVRASLFDFAAYPQWNPYIVSVDGAVENGSKVFLTVKPPGGPEINTTATILSVTENRLSWRGVGMSQLESVPITLPIPGVLSANHDFIIEELGPEKTLFLNNIKWSGASVPFYDLKPMEAGLRAMNEALKKRAEANAR